MRWSDVLQASWLCWLIAIKSNFDFWNFALICMTEKTEIFYFQFLFVPLAPDVLCSILTPIILDEWSLFTTCFCFVLFTWVFFLVPFHRFSSVPCSGYEGIFVLASLCVRRPLCQCGLFVSLLQQGLLLWMFHFYTSSIRFIKKSNLTYPLKGLFTWWQQWEVLRTDDSIVKTIPVHTDPQLQYYACQAISWQCHFV